MTAATIDIGTNTTLALLAQQEAGEMEILRDQQTPNRMGESLDNGGELSAEAIALNVDLLGEIVRDYRRAGAEGFIATATSVLRRARNRHEFISAVRDILKLDVEVLSGTQEAALSFAGSVSSLDLMPNERIGVIDLGGGSTEIIEGEGHVPGQSCSLNTGAVYSTRRHFGTDKPTEEEIEELRRDVGENLGSMVNPLRRSEHPWVLAGGTGVTLAILKHGLKRYIPARIAGTKLARAEIEQRIEQFADMHPDEIQRLPGIPLNRGKYLLAGTVLLSEIYQALNIDEVTITERGLRHGLWLARFGERGRA